MDGLIAHDPTAGVDRPQAWHRVPRSLHASEVNALLRTPATLRDRAILELFYAAGVRVGEVVTAQLNDLELDKHTLLVHGKGSRDRIVPLGVPAVNALREYVERERSATSCPFLFVGHASNYGCRQLSRQWVWRIVKRQAGIAGIGHVQPAACGTPARRPWWKAVPMAGWRG